MIATRLLTAAAWLCLLAGTVAAGVAATGRTVSTAVLSRPLGDPPAVVAGGDTTSPDSLARVVAARDLFRLGRRPASTPYEPDKGVTPAGAAPTPRPNLRLVGLVTGRRASALIEGLPGVDGARVVAAGDRIGSLTIGPIEGARVHVVGPDTTWILTIKHP